MAGDEAGGHRDRATPPFSAEHIGSLLRPAELKAAHARHRDGALDRASYEAVLARAIERAVRQQEDLGLRPITDGEFGRNSWFGFFFERMGGFRLETAAFVFRDEAGHTY